MNENLKNLPFVSQDEEISVRDEFSERIPIQYLEFLRWRDGGRLENCKINITCQGEEIEEYLDIFMPYSLLISNEYLIGYEPFFEINSPEYFSFKNILTNYFVFCSTYEPNSFFAFLKEDMLSIIYINLDKFPFTEEIVFDDFNTFINNIIRY